MSQANCSTYGCDEEWGDINVNECNREIPGGSNAGLALECNHTITDPSNEAQIAANKAAGLAHLITDISITINKATPNIVESRVPCKPGALSGYDRTGTYYNPNVNAANSVSHNTLFKGKRLGGFIIYECGAEGVGQPQVTWIDEEILVTGSRVLPGSDKEMQGYEGDLVWRGLNDNLIYDAPTNFFD